MPAALIAGLASLPDLDDLEDQAGEPDRGCHLVQVNHLLSPVV
jgi:hypothetical protein